MTDSLSQALFQLHDVSLGYGDNTVLSGISMHLNCGQVVALIGGSGSGKSTILRGISGQIAAQKGKIELFGQDLAHVSRKQLNQLRQRMGVLFQQGALFTDLNVFDNVAYPLRELTKLTEAQILDRVLQKLDAVGLRATAHLDISEVSGGMARRIALARSIVLEPQMVLYDEPFAGLDPVSMNSTASLIKRLTKQLNCAALLISHDIDESFLISDYVYMIGHGGLMTQGTPQQIRSNPDRDVQNFLKGLPSTESQKGKYPVTPAFEKWLKEKRGEL